MSTNYNRPVNRLLTAALTAVALAFAGCGASITVPDTGSCLFSGLTQLIYPIPGSTNVPNALQQIVFATSQLFPSGFNVLIHSDPNPNTATNGTAAFFQRIQQTQVPQPSAALTISNPFYESAALSGSFSHGTYYAFLNDSRVKCMPTPAGSFTTQ